MDNTRRTTTRTPVNGTENPHRSTINLTGEWDFTTDPDDVGIEEQWYSAEEGWPEGARSVEVPHSWQEIDEYRDYTGTAWYRRTVRLEPMEDGNRRVLRFDAVDHETTAWVNGTRVGTNEGGYLPFSVDVTDAVETGENAVAVRVVDPEDVTEIPHGKQGEPWYMRVSGIWQDVALETLPDTRVIDVRVTPDLDADVAIVDVEAADPDPGRSELTATASVVRGGEPVSEEEGTLDSSGAVRLTLPIEEPVYWSPEDPALYDLRVKLKRSGSVVDRYDDYFGMRSIETREGRLHLNGEPYYMRGALDQGYYPETLYRPFSETLFEEEIRTAKELGFNLLRKHIKPAHPKFLELADRLGMLVWAEPANPSVYTERSKQAVREQIRRLIDRDYNRPSVIVWSLYNEEWGIGYDDDEEPLWTDEEKQAYLTELFETTKKRDPTRLVCDNSGWAHVATDVNDYHRYFVSPDRADAWDKDLRRIVEHPEENYGATETDPRDAPIIVSEFGTWGLCDVPAILDRYDGTPAWFSHEFLDDELKRPAGIEDRFENTGLSDAFGDLGSLATAWQEREYVSVKDVIERMRIRKGIAGYVITEFSDIEWEFNGILDYFREEKAFYDRFDGINSDRMVRIEPNAHALWSDGTLTADVVLVNDSTEPIEGELEWSAFNAAGSMPVQVDGFSIERFENAISINVPAVSGVDSTTLSVSPPDGPSNDETITVVPRPGSDEVDTRLYTDVTGLAEGLRGSGVTVVETLDESVDVAIVVEDDPSVRQLAERGGAVLYVPGTDGHMVENDVFEYRELPEDESWNLVASLFYVARSAFDELPNRVPGWEFEGLYPYAVVDDVEYGVDDVLIGYTEGWLANWSGAVTVRERGGGTVAACTFRLTEQYGDHPVATALLTALITELDDVDRKRVSARDREM